MNIHSKHLQPRRETQGTRREKAHAYRTEKNLSPHPIHCAAQLPLVQGFCSAGSLLAINSVQPSKRPLALTSLIRDCRASARMCWPRFHSAWAMRYDCNAWKPCRGPWEGAHHREKPSNNRPRVPTLGKVN